MRRHALSAAAVLLCLFTASPAGAAKEESFGVTLAKTAGGAAAGKGGEFLVNAIGGAIFDAACKDKPLAGADQYLCDALGGVTGKSEEQWKKNVEKQLTEIHSKLVALDAGQDAIQAELKLQHKEMTLGFDQAAAKVEATRNITRIENLWDKYVRQFDEENIESDLKRESMVALAKDIIANKLHTKLGDLNVVLTKGTLDGQSLLRYPFHAWRVKQGKGAPPEGLQYEPVTEFAEKKFSDFRFQQHKAYVMYLWAAAVIESDCRLRGEKCAPPRSTRDFQRDYEHYTRVQIEEFNKALDSTVLAYALTRSADPRTLPGLQTSEAAMVRGNLLTALTLADGKGWWGRVISMGNAWDGSLEVKCGDKSRTVKPVLQYTVPVDDLFGKTVDWWVSRSRNDVYDEVHFAKEWKINHYHIADAGVGQCRVNGGLPGNQGRIPWMQASADVVQVTTADGRTFPFGSFLAVQRAGGTYALASGKWHRPSSPRTKEEGPGRRTNVRRDWTIDTDRKGAPWAAMISEGDGEYVVNEFSSRIWNREQLYLYNDKKVYFPEGGTMQVNLQPHSDCARVCRGVNDGDVVMDYDVWNNDTESKKGEMRAVVAAYFTTHVANPESLSLGLWAPAGSGLVIDGSYSRTGDQKTKSVTGSQSGRFTAQPNVAYYLQYLIDFDVYTEGRYTNRTHWMYRGKITPSWLYLTK